MRKTIPVAFILDKMNEYLENSPDCETNERQKMINFTDDLLMKHGAYKGYKILNWDSNTMSSPDETRIMFYY